MTSPCLTKNCRGFAAADCRGLCMKCYSQAKKLVQDGKTSWDELESMGLATPKAGTPFLDQFNASKKK